MANLISQIPTVMLLLADSFQSLPPLNPSAQILWSLLTHLVASQYLLMPAAAIIIASNATRLTFLAPPDSALFNGFLHSESLHGHITIAGVLSYQTLLTLPSNTTLPTLHQNTTLVVGIDGQRVSFNDVLVTVPNLYIDGSCAVHGVDGPLVPIPSLLEDSMKPSTQALPSQVAPKKHQTRQMFNYIRFIRRANRPNFSDEESETNHP